MLHKIELSKLLFLVVNYLLIIIETTAQEPNFMQLSTPNGLPSTQCNKIIEDKKGYIWVFTNFGISKHNGKKFVPACTNIPITEACAYAVYQNKEGTIYFANSFGNFYKIDNDSAYILPQVNGHPKEIEPQNNIIQIYDDEHGHLYYTNYKASFEYTFKSKKCRKLLPSGNKTQLFQIDFDLKTENLIHFRSSPKLKTNSDSVSINFTIGKKKTKLYLNHFNAMSRSFSCQLGSTLFFTAGSKLYSLTENGKLVSKEIPHIFCMKKDLKKNIWVLTPKGVYVFNKNFEEVNHFLSEQYCSDVCFDQFGGIWISTLYSGVFYAKNLEEKIFKDPTDPFAPVLQSESLKSGPAFSSSKGCIYIFRNNLYTKIHAFESNYICNSILEDEEFYYLSTNLGLFKKTKKGNTLVELKDLQNERLFTTNAFNLLNDTMLVYGGTRIYLFTKKGIFHKTISKNKINKMQKFDKHRFVLFDHKGIWIYDWKKKLLTPLDTTYKKTLPVSLVKINETDFLVGTRGSGLYSYTKNRKALLPSTYTIILDVLKYKNHLIVSTNTGVHWTSLSNNNSVSGSNPITNIQAKHIRIDSLTHTLWISNQRGLLKTNLDRLEQYVYFPIVFQSIHSNNATITVPKTPQPLQLNYTQNNIRFNIDFLNYNNTSTEFYYTLIGKNPLKGRIYGDVLQVQNLNPGTYTLRIYPVQGDTFNIKHFAQLTFVLHPAFWQTFWFKFLMVLGGILIVVLITTFYFNRKRKHEKVISSLNSVLAENKLTALKAQINPHFISNSLSAIQSLVQGNRIDEANLYIAKFSLLIRNVLKYSDKNASLLSEELKLISLNIELEKLRFTNQFSYTLEIDSDIDIERIYIPPLITQPIVENAIWHGLLPLEGFREAKLTIQIKIINNQLIISIIDNGVGRKSKPSSYKIGNLNYRESKGSILIQSRIENLNKLHHTTNARIDIIDLLNELGDPIGTKVDIVLPLELLLKLEDLNL